MTEGDTSKQGKVLSVNYENVVLKRKLRAGTPVKYKGVDYVLVISSIGRKAWLVPEAAD